MTQKLVIITGATSGIGMAMARIFSAAGYSLGLFARNLSAMESLNLPNSICVSTDVTDFEAVKEAMISTEKKFGPVDCLINNAGLLKSGGINDMPLEDHVEMLNVNVLGVINSIKSVLPGMRIRQMGTIINISSIADRNARPQFPTYAATKAAIKSLSESLRMENASYGIRISNLAPARIRTVMDSPAGIAGFQDIYPRELAKTALWIYEQPQTICIRDMVFAPTYYEP